MRKHVDKGLAWFLSPTASALPLLDIFVVFGLGTVFVTRAYLALTGYPQIGGEVLHIAHMLWGGLALTIAFLYLAISLNPNKKLAMMVGGIGFGLFIDELGKFITVDNDYFFKPTASLIIIIFIALWAIMRAIISRREHKPLLPPAEWPTQFYSKAYVYAWLVLQTFAVGIEVMWMLFGDIGTVPEKLQVPYVIYFFALLTAWLLVLTKQYLNAASTIRTIGIATVIAIMPINFYQDQFIAAVGFILVVLVILATSKDYEQVKSV